MNNEPIADQTRKLDPEIEALLRGLLSGCAKASEICLKREIQYANGTDQFTVATRLIKTALMLAKALEGQGSSFTHRIVVEHTASASQGGNGNDRAASNATPTPSENFRKTIKSGSEQ